MSDVPASSGPDSTGERLVAVTLAEWSDVLEEPVRIELDSSCTVLVGKNAAGKSIILESIENGALASCYRRLVSTLGPRKMGFEVELSGQRLSYDYEWRFDSEFEDIDELDVDAIESSLLWSEACLEMDSQDTIWRVVGGKATLRSGEDFVMSSENGLLRLGATPIELPPEVARLKQLMKGVKRLSAGVPRGSRRRPLQLAEITPGKQNRKTWVAGEDHRVIKVMMTLVIWSEKNEELFQSVVSIAKRLGLLTDLEVKIDKLHSSSNQPNVPQRMATVLVDGHDFGYSSDGTLRVMEIVIGLLTPHTRVLLLEEPETAIHPGLLRRLLAEIDAHALDRQIVISTHSPIIVDWAKPESIRLIERTDTEIQARKLSPAELDNLRSYLDDDFLMSDVIYSEGEV